MASRRQATLRRLTVRRPNDPVPEDELDTLTPPPEEIEPPAAQTREVSEDRRARTQELIAQRQADRAAAEPRGEVRDTGPTTAQRRRRGERLVRGREQARADANVGLVGKAFTPITQFVGGVAETAAALPKGIQALLDNVEDVGRAAIGRNLTDTARARRNENRLLFRAGEGLENLFRFPSDPAIRESFLAGTVPRALGSAVGFMIGGLAGRAIAGAAGATRGAAAAARAATAARARGATEAVAQSEAQLASMLAQGSRAQRIIGAAAGAGVLGAAVQAGSGHTDPLRADSPLHKRLLGFAVDVGLGATEGVTVATLFNRLDKAAGGVVSRSMLGISAKRGEALAESGFQALEEAFQEGIQGLGDNALAKFVFDADRISWSL